MIPVDDRERAYKLQMKTKGIGGVGREGGGGLCVCVCVCVVGGGGCGCVWGGVQGGGSFATLAYS